MKILKGILLDSEKYYLDAQKKIMKKLANLSSGSVKERVISGKKYYYLQKRVDKRIVHKYLGKEKPVALLKQIKMRKSLQAELKKMKDALRMLKRAKGRKHD